MWLELRNLKDCGIRSNIPPMGRESPMEMAQPGRLWRRAVPRGYAGTRSRWVAVRPPIGRNSLCGSARAVDFNFVDQLEHAGDALAVGDRQLSLVEGTDSASQHNNTIGDRNLEAGEVVATLVSQVDFEPLQ